MRIIHKSYRRHQQRNANNANKKYRANSQQAIAKSLNFRVGNLAKLAAKQKAQHGSIALFSGIQEQSRATQGGINLRVAHLEKTHQTGVYKNPGCGSCNHFVQRVFLETVPDSDGDGVVDSDDICPKTPQGVSVESNGCPSDSDEDGVYDHKDKCLGTPLGAKVNEDGCWQIGIIYFDQDKSFIKGTEYSKLEEVFDVMMRNPGLRIQAEGHTSSLASADYNLDLSEQRVKTVQKYFTDLGIALDRVTIKWHGLTQPTTTNMTEEGAALNRRVVISPYR